jgi:phosphoglycolate phosphatase
VTEEKAVEGEVTLSYYCVYLFDFDYTLADPERAVIACYRDVLDRHGHTSASDDDICRTVGYPVTDSFTMLTGITDDVTLRQYYKEFRNKADEVMAAYTALYPETIPVFRGLRVRGIKTGIISTKFRYRIEDILERHSASGLADLIIGGEDVIRPKPDPQGIFLAIERLGAQKTDVLYIGDSLVDANAAKNAGVDFAAVTTGTTTAEDFAGLPYVRIMKDLNELMQGAV